MGEKIVYARLVRKTETAENFDEALGRAIDHIDDVAQEFGPSTRADVIDSDTNTFMTVSPGSKNSGKSVGYNAGFANAWDRMMQRRALREAKGQRLTDD